MQVIAVQVFARKGKMNQSTVTVLVIAFLGLLAVFVTVASILILCGGKVYHKIPEKVRPRRWFVAIFFSYFVLPLVPPLVVLPAFNPLPRFGFLVCGVHGLHRSLVRS